MLASAGIADRLADSMLGLQTLKSRAAVNDPEVLRAAARQFEAMLLQTLLKGMRETSWSADDDPFAPSDSLKHYRELLEQHLAQRIVQGRGLGFAEKMADHMLKGQGMGESATASPPRTAGWSLPQPGSPVAAGRAEWAKQAPNAPAEAGASPPATTDPGKRKARFLQTMRPYAEAAAQSTGLTPDFILAHAALESGWGEREIRHQDGRSSHNLFGIKAGGSWTGPTVETQTTEYRHGLPVKIRDRFRAYADYRQAFGDYANLLMNRYDQAIRAGADADAFAQALVAGGYATDPAYAGKLRAVIASIARMRA